MSVETDITPPAADPTPVSAAPAPEPAKAEAPSIRFGNASANIQRAGEELTRQFRAAEETVKAPTAVVEDPDTQSGTPSGGQPAAPIESQPSELEVMRRELDALKKERDSESETRRAAQLQSLNQQQQNDYQELVTDVSAAQRKAVKDQQRLDDLALEYQQALNDRDTETAQAVAQAWNEQREDAAVSARAAQRLEQQQQQFKNYADQQYHTAHVREQAAQIGKIAAKYGLTPDEIKAVNANLDVTKPFEVMDAVLEAQSKKLNGTVSAKEKEAKEQAARIREEEREKFDNSPGAQPHPGGSTNTASGAYVGIKKGNSSAMLQRAWQPQR